MPPTPTVQDNQRADAKALGDIITSLRSSMDNIGTLVKTINDRGEELKKETNSRLDAVDLMIKELRQRVDSGARIDRDSGALVSRLDGRILATPSREMCDFLVKATMKPREATNVAAMERELSTSVGADGGYLIPQDRIPEILQLITAYGAARRNALMLPMKNNTRIWPTLVSGVNTYWIPENASFTESLPQFGQATITAKKLAGLCHWSSELFEDADSDLGAILMDLFARSMAQEEDHQFFTGTGAGADPFIGWLYDPSVNVVAMNTGDTTFNKINFDYLLAMQTATPTAGLVGAKYFLHRSVLAALQQLKETTGGYIMTPPTQGAAGTIWGYPYEVVEIMPGTATVSPAGKPFVAFGNPKHIYFGDRKSLEVATSKDYAFRNDQVYMRLLERIGFKVALGAALTILKSAAS